MKSYIFMTMLLVAALLVAGVANAAVTFSATPLLGGPDQERNDNATTTVSVTDSTLNASNTTTVRFTITDSSGFDVQFDSTQPTGVTFVDASNVDIATWDGTSKTLNLKADVPDDLDAVDSNLDPLKAQAATISNDRDSATTAVQMQAKNHLEIDKTKITIDGKTKSVDDGDSIDKIRIGDEIDIEITVENTFDKDDDELDIDTDNVDVEVDIDDSDFDINEDDEVDINADDKETVSFSNLQVDDDVKDGRYDLEITVSGTDDKGAKHGQKATIELKVEREKHEISIRSASLSRSTVSCDSPNTDLTVRLANIGRNDEDAVAVEVKNTILGIEERQSGFSLDEDDSMSRTFSLLPTLDKPGTYSLDVIAFWEDSIESDRELITLTVRECEDDTTTDATTTVVVTPPTTTPTTTTPVATPTSNGDSSSVPRARVSSKGSDYTIPLLVIGVVVALALLGILIGLLVKGGSRRPE